MESRPAAIRAAQRGTTRKRAPRLELSLDRIVEAGTRIADRDGLVGISMAKVAQELGFATMSLYRHVDSKEELLVHMQDAAIGPPPPAIAASPDWRAGLARWTRELVAGHREHPWTVEIPLTGPPTLPRSIAWLDAGLAVMAALPLRPVEKLSTMNLLAGYARNEVSLLAIMDSDADLGPSHRPDLEYEEQLRAVTTTHHLPALAAMLDEHGLFDLPPDAPSDSGDDFMIDFGLQRILDGIEALTTRRTKTP